MADQRSTSASRTARHAFFSGLNARGCVWLGRPSEGVVDRQDNHGPDDRADETGPLPRLIPADGLAEIGRDKRSGDAEQCGDDEPARVSARCDQLGDEAGQEPDDDRPQDVHGGNPCSGGSLFYDQATRSVYAASAKSVAIIAITRAEATGGGPSRLWRFHAAGTQPFATGLDRITGMCWQGHYGPDAT